MRKLRWVMAVMVVALSVGRAGWGAEGGVPMGLEAPSIDKVVAVEPITLKTKGKTPEEAFVMLGDAVGIACGPRMVGGVLNRGAWQNRVFDNVDFELEKVSFWQAALRLEDHTKVMPTGQGHWMTVLNMPSIPKPEQATDTGPLRVQLFVDKAAAALDKNGRLAKLVTVEFLLDPRLTFMDLGKMEVDGADDAGGKRLETEAKTIRCPGAVAAGTRAVQHGDRAATGEVQIRWGAGEKTPTLDVFRGRVPAVVATKVERVEFVVQDGVAMDMKPYRVGDWSVQVTSSKPGGTAGNLRIDHEIELELERMTETAPPFPRLTFVRFEEGASGELGDLVGKTTADGKKRTVTVKLRGEEKVPGKIVVDVPLEAKAVVLPFEFRNVGLGEGGGI